MDKQLLKALDNLSNALEMIADALEKKGGGGSTAPTTTALQGGDFGKSLKEINAGIKSIKIDTKQILKSQQTILSMQKKKDADKKTGIVEEAGGSKESENKMKKGVGIILLIAIAVLAIGMAFKLVGKIDFLSVIGLSLAILVMAVAFEKVAKLKITLKEAAVTSGALVLIALAITISSWIMSLIVPISFTKLLTATFIAITFAAMSKYLENIFIATAVFDKMKVSKTALILTLVSISAAITASSWIMQLIRPISAGQGLTAILIALTFAAIGYSLHKIGTAVAMFKKIPGLKPMDLVWVLLAVSTAITISSWILQLIMPLGFSQMLTGILIATMFLLISFNLEKIAIGVVAFKKTGVSAKDLLFVMVGIAAAITVSSWLLNLIIPIGLWQFLTALGITILFAIMSYVMPELAGGIAIVGKVLGTSKVFLIPLVMVAISLAIMLSSHILAESAEMQLQRIIQIAVFGVALAIMVLAMLPSVLIVGAVAMAGIGAGAIALGVLLIPLIAAAIMVSSHILSVGKYDKFPSVGWSLGVGISMIFFAGAVIAMGAIALSGIGIPAVLAGLLIVPLIALSIVLADKIISKGKYDKYPGLKWVLSVGATMTGFAAAIIGLGILALTGIGLVAVIAGAGVALLIAQTIVLVDKIIGKGKYDKYPGAKWILSIGTTMTSFGTAMIALGLVALTGLGLVAVLAGAGVALIIAQTIVETDKIIAKGKYNKYPDYKWILSVGSTMAGFGAAVVLLGGLAISGLGLGALAIIVGAEMVPIIAQTIVDTDKVIAKGKYNKYPSLEWATSVGSLMAIFGAAVVGVGVMILSSLGLGFLAIEAGADAVKTIAQSIVDAGTIFAKSGSVWKNGPTKAWAEGVSIAIGAFAPVYEVLAANTGLFASGVSVDDMKTAIMTISQGIVDAAIFFSENTAPFDAGKYPSEKWAKGVGGAIGAFAPIFKQMSEDSGWFTSGDDVMQSMSNAIVTIASAIVSAASVLSTVTPEMWQSFPSDKWGSGIKSSVLTFIDLFDTMDEKGYSVAFFTIKTKVLSMAVNSMAVIARIIHTNQKYFKSTIPKNFIDGLSKGVLGFGKLAKDLDKLLIVEKMVTKEKFNVFGGLSQKETKMQRERRDLALVRDVVVQMAAVARILFSNKKYFQNTSFLTRWTKDVIVREGAVMKFTLLNLDLNKYKRMFSKETMAERVAKSMVRTSLILYKAKDAFAMEVDPNFMKNVGQNMIDFNEIVKKLAESEGEGKGLMGRIGDAAEGLLGTDPISQIANRMVTLAKGYDAMASALIKLSFAMKLLKVDSMAKLGGITRSMLGKKPIEDDEGEEKSGMTGVLPKFSEVGRKKSDSPSVNSGGGMMKNQKVNKDSIFYVSERLEELIKIMGKIERQTSTVDEYIENKAGIKPPPEKSDFG